MSIKDRIKNEVEKIVAKGHQVEQEVIIFIRDDYTETLNDLEVDIKIERELTLEYLEGVEEGLVSVGHESGKLMSRVADTLVEVSRDFGTRSVEAAQKAALEARSALEKAQDTMGSLVQKSEEQMRAAYVHFVEAEKDAKARLNGVGEGIKAYVNREKTVFSESVIQALNDTAESAKDLVLNLSQLTEAKSRELIEYSKDKVSDWLREMADKIKPRN